MKRVIAWILAVTLTVCCVPTLSLGVHAEEIQIIEAEEVIVTEETEPAEPEAAQEDALVMPEENTEEIAVMAAAEEREVLLSGICGQDVDFTLYADGYLELTGFGPMGEYPYSEAPWFNHRSQIKHLVIHEGITNVSSYAFSACTDMVTATLADSVKEIGKFAFDCCYALTSIDFGKGLTTIGDSVFRYCEKLEDAVLPESLTSMGEFAFFSCRSLPEVTIPKNITQINFGAFMFCSGMKRIVIPEGVTQINDNGLRGCSSLTEVVLPESVTRIGEGAFMDCTNMESVNIPAGVTEICNDAFSYCASLKKAVIPQGITVIPVYAFYCCESLKEIVIPDSVTTIHDDAFASCTSLPEINIPKSVTYIGSGVFNSCDSLYQVTLPSGITFVGDYLFAYCDNLLSVTIPAGVTSIGYNAFYWCDNLAHVLYTGTAEQWEAISIEEGNGTLQWGDHHNEAKGDEFKVLNRVTCTGKEVYSCSICGKTEGEKFPNGKHNLTGWSIEIAPTCTEKGLERRDCTKCEYYETREKATSGHSYTAEVTPPTNLAGGYTTYTCVCGDSYQGKFTKPLGLDKPIVTADYIEETETVLLHWEAIASADYYEIYRSTSSKKNYKSIGITEGIEYTDDTVSAGKTYYYKVQAICKIDEDLDSDKSDYVSVKVGYPRPEITEVTNNSSGYPVIKWGKVSGAKKYEVWCAEGADGTYKKLTTTSSTSYTHSKAKMGREYYYKVRAYGSSASYAGAFSEIHCGVKKLSTPTITVKLDNDTGTAKITWKSISGATRYWLHCSVNGGDYDVVDIVEGNSYTHEALEVGNTYTYTLMADNGTVDAISAGSAEKAVTVKCGRPALTLTNDPATGKPVLTWEEVDGADGYEVQYATSSKGKYKQLTVVNAPGCIHEEAAAGKTYYYKVRAIDANGVAGDFCSYKSVTCDCAATAITEVTNNSSGYPVIKWGKVSGAKKYEVWCAEDADGTYKKLTTTSSTSYTHSKAKKNVDYYYKIRAYGSSTSSTGVFSDVVKGWRKLAQPNITLEITDTGKPCLNWKVIKDAAYYEVYCAAEEGAYTKIAEQKELRYVDVSAVIDTKYSYKVIAVAADYEQNSSESAPKSIYAACARPVITGSLDGKKPMISWDDVEGAKTYIVYRSTKKSSGYKKIGQTEDLSYTDSTAKKGKTYYYKVVAVTEYSSSVYSNYVKIKSK